MKNIVLKIIGILSLLTLIAGLVLYLIFPFYNTIVLQIQELNPQKIATNSSIKFYTTIKQPAINQIIEQETSPGSIEDMAHRHTQEALSKGLSIYTVEDKNTTLIIPSLNIKGKLTDGQTSEALNRGFWFYPTSAPPGEQGNTIIIGHRFQYLPPDTRTFFNLDKIKLGDKILIKQNNNSFTYTVVQTKIVKPNDTRVLAKTPDYRLTLITCTPLWTSKQRLVVIAKLDRVYQSI